jgi:hypothetical protein
MSPDELYSAVARSIFYCLRKLSIGKTISSIDFEMPWCLLSELEIEHLLPDRELMKSSTHVLTTLVVVLATIGQSTIATPIDRMMSQNAIDSYKLSSKQCSPVLAQIKSNLTNVTRFETSNLDKYDGTPPRGRTQSLTIISAGIQESRSLAMAKKIIASCPKIGSVRFVINGSDEQNVYGLLNGKVQIFKCTGMENPNKWGEYSCT